MFCFVMATTLTPAAAGELLANSQQLIVVTSENWSADRGTLVLLERNGTTSWRRASDDVPVMLGRKGLAWGVGLHKARATKREGDGRSPAGVFELERVWGGVAARRAAKFPYRQMSDVMEGIDDAQSRFYNRFIDVAQIPAQERDWTRTETVRAANPMFRYLVEVKHNWQQRPGYGSNIWLHIWKAPGVATSGCTAMEIAALEQLVHWLDAGKRPLLVQMPRAELVRLFPELATAARAR
jgi:L,D-peptidoglycan transpeptidase YkuD (ErfK/YbiS/YcfS/YnhG family)